MAEAYYIPNVIFFQNMLPAGNIFRIVSLSVHEAVHNHMYWNKAAKLS